MKGQGLPITVIIIAALGILVLIVISAIFGGQMFKFAREAQKCPGKCVIREGRALPLDAPAGIFVARPGGTCDPDFETKLSGIYLAAGTPKDSEFDEWKCDSCCVPIG